MLIQDNQVLLDFPKAEKKTWAGVTGPISALKSIIKSHVSGTGVVCIFTKQRNIYTLKSRRFQTKKLDASYDELYHEL